MLKVQLNSRNRRHVQAAALAFALLGSGALLAGAQTSTPSTGGGCAAGTSGPCVAIGQYDIYFKPNLATIPASEAVKVELTNHGVIEHNFSVTDHENAGLQNLNIKVNVQPGDKGEATINAPAGDYYFFCDIPGHEAAGMRGYITVEADATITTSEATVTPRAG